VRYLGGAANFPCRAQPLELVPLPPTRLHLMQAPREQKNLRPCAKMLLCTVRRGTHGLGEQGSSLGSCSPETSGVVADLLPPLSQGELYPDSPTNLFFI